MGHLDVLTMGAGDHSWSFTSTAGHLAMEHSSRVSTSFFGVDLDSVGGGRFDRRWLPPAIDRLDTAEEMLRDLEEHTDPELSEQHREDWIQMIRDSGYEAIWMVAWWFVMLLFLVPWGACLVWRWRRMKRLAAGSAEPLARRRI